MHSPFYLVKEDRKFKKKLKNILGFYPKNLEIYKQALLHSSINYVIAGNKINNERLEFIGDSVISTVVSDKLYRIYPNADEGKLSIYRSRIISRDSLNKLANYLNLREFITYKDNKCVSHKYIDGNALEALIGAIYYDKGYKFCLKFIYKLLNKYLDLNSIKDNNQDFKSSFLQLIQKNKLNVTFNTYENCELNEKIPHFLCEVCLNNRFLCSGKGWSKKEAEQNASKEALLLLEKTNSNT